MCVYFNKLYTNYLYERIFTFQPNLQAVNVSGYHTFCVHFDSFSKTSMLVYCIAYPNVKIMIINNCNTLDTLLQVIKLPIKRACDYNIIYYVLYTTWLDETISELIWTSENSPFIDNCGPSYVTLYYYSRLDVMFKYVCTYCNIQITFISLQYNLYINIMKNERFFIHI